MKFEVNGEQVELVEFDAAWVQSAHYCEVEFEDGRRELREWAEVYVAAA